MKQAEALREWIVSTAPCTYEVNGGMILLDALIAAYEERERELTVGLNMAATHEAHAVIERDAMRDDIRRVVEAWDGAKAGRPIHDAIEALRKHLTPEST